MIIIYRTNSSFYLNGSGGFRYQNPPIILPGGVATPQTPPPPPPFRRPYCTVYSVQCTLYSRPVRRGTMSNTGHCDISVTIVQIKKKYIQDLFSIIFLLIRGIFYFNICIYISNIDHYINK